VKKSDYGSTMSSAGTEGHGLEDPALEVHIPELPPGPHHRGGEYDYGVSWIFRQDGSLEMEAALTGILLGKGVEATACESCAGLAEGRQPISGSERTGTLVGPNVIAPNHQQELPRRPP
jgi:hypothetical protein